MTTRLTCRRRGFTLVELLITISIVAIMAGTIALAMISAQQSAKIAKTKALVARLNNIVTSKYESYSTRRVPLEVRLQASMPVMARSRLDALRDLMRMEMPDRWYDVMDGPAVIAPDGERLPEPAVHQAYFARWQAVHAQNSRNPSDRFAGAECLYLIVTLGQTEEPGGREAFPTGSVGDTDADGMPEFLDAWGRPIQFLRWAPGFISDLQPADPALRLPDPFDPQRVYPVTGGSMPQPQPTFALTPLIYSAGPDKLYDIYDGPEGVNPLRYSLCNNNPFIGYNDAANFPRGQVGTPADGSRPGEARNLTNNWTDNIHNHLLLAK